jgi:hypothetical protein
MDEPKLIDLEPYKWVSDREKPKEPIFGPGWPILLGIILSVVIAVALIEWNVMPRQFAAALGGIIGTLTAWVAAQLTE